MNKPTKTYDRFDVVVVPFPFTDSEQTKRRPALVLSSSKYFNNKSHATVLAMITSALHNPRPLDIEIKNLKSAGLPSQSIVRMKLFTLDHQLILNKLGKLAKEDSLTVSSQLGKLFSDD
jgi:mRNA interferase MazF